MSLAEVAARAGVSAATVSRVINHDPRVRPETATAVRAAIEALNYTPPGEADRRRSRSRSRVGQHTGRVALLFPDTQVSALRTALSGRLLSGMDAPLGTAGLSLTLLRLPRAETLPASLNRRNVDGVMVRAARHVPGWLAQGLRGLPHIWIFDTGGSHLEGDVVLPDNEQVARLAADYFHNRGRQRVVVFNEWPEHPELVTRIEVLSRSVNVVGSACTVAQLEELLTSDLRADAVFMAGPLPLVEVHKLLKRLGYQLGVDLDLLSCSNDESTLSALEPRPANIDIRAEAVGRAAAETLLWRMANPGEPERRVVITPQLTAGD